MLVVICSEGKLHYIQIAFAIFLILLGVSIFASVFTVCGLVVFHTRKQYLATAQPEIEEVTEEEIMPYIEEPQSHIHYSIYPFSRN